MIVSSGREIGYVSCLRGPSKGPLKCFFLIQGIRTPDLIHFIPAARIEACRLNKAQIKSLNFVVCSAFSKIFNTRSSEIVTHCMQIFDCDNIESILLKRRTKFMQKFIEGVFGDVFG